MKNDKQDTFNYKGYSGSVEYSALDGVYYGKILDIKDLVNYEALTEAELKLAFQGAVEDYLNTIEDIDKTQT